MSKFLALKIAALFLINDAYANVDKPSKPFEFEGVVSYVYDGDRIVVEGEAEKILVRLKWIDAPNDGQELNDEAREFLSDLILGKNVKVIANNGINNGCIYGEVMGQNQNYNIEMIGAGYTNIMQGSPKSYIAAALKAKDKGVGIWSESTRVKAASSYLNGYEYKGLCNFEDTNIIDYTSENDLKAGRDEGRFIETILSILIGLLIGIGLLKILSILDDPRVGSKFKKSRDKKGKK